MCRSTVAFRGMLTPDKRPVGLDPFNLDDLQVFLDVRDAGDAARHLLGLLDVVQ